MTAERGFDFRLVATMALREKQSQQNYRPYIGVHKWFARRPGVLFRALLLAEFGSGPLEETFFESNVLETVRVGDPFMGGGTPVIEANRLGCDVFGYDINPMAHWIVRQEIDNVDLFAYEKAATKVMMHLERKVGHLYQTKCLRCGCEEAKVKYFLWVKTQRCAVCCEGFDLFPEYLLADDWRHPKFVIICASCGEITEADDKGNPGKCPSCNAFLSLAGPARKSQCTCPYCGVVNRYPDPQSGFPRHRMIAIEYYCERCKPGLKGRLFKKPDPTDITKYNEAAATWLRMKAFFVPDDEIPQGQETRRLHRFGYRYYREMFNERQLLGLELIARAINAYPDTRVRNALITTLCDFVRYQNMLVRYDTKALKSEDIFCFHAYPVGLVQCECNLLGVSGGPGRKRVGSGGWLNIVEKFLNAKSYCEKPFEVYQNSGRKVRIYVNEWIGESRSRTLGPERRKVFLKCQSSTLARLPEASLDAVLTDPPYFGNVQYAELMDFCAVWVAKLNPEFKSARSTFLRQLHSELSGGKGGNGLEKYATGLSQVFHRFAKALKPDGLFAFTFHHNKLEAYAALIVALLNARLRCTACFPCPSEMHGSIHILGQSASRTDTVFVCRRRISRWNPFQPPLLKAAMEHEENLRSIGFNLTSADRACIRAGLAVSHVLVKLEARWDGERSASRSLDIARGALKEVIATKER